MSAQLLFLFLYAGLSGFIHGHPKNFFKISLISIRIVHGDNNV